MAAPKQETQIETVKMDDGRAVDFAGKRKMLKSSSIVDGEPIVRLDFRNGETRTFKIPGALYNKFALHGAEQKLGDEIAGIEDVEDCVLAVDELTQRLEAGEWGIKREANGMAGTSVLLKALVEVTGKDVAAVKTFLATKSQAEKIALRNSAKIKPVVERLEAEKAAKGTSKVDTEALLGELA
jgi:uncharacterized small protein (DUF1192 family)